jgi:hypothetical protein
MRRSRSATRLRKTNTADQERLRREPLDIGNLVQARGR